MSYERVHEGKEGRGVQGSSQAQGAALVKTGGGRWGSGWGRDQGENLESRPRSSTESSIVRGLSEECRGAGV